MHHVHLSLPPLTKSLLNIALFSLNHYPYPSPTNPNPNPNMNFPARNYHMGVRMSNVHRNYYNHHTHTQFPSIAAVYGGDDLVAAARFHLLKKKRRPRVRRGGITSRRSFSYFAPRYRSTMSNFGSRFKFLLSKKLQKSDVSGLKRIVLPKKSTEEYLPALPNKEGIVMNMDDMDGINMWFFKFRYWPNNNSRMYVLEGTGDFCEEHDLKIGDYIMLYRDYVNRCYVIQAMKAAEVENLVDVEVEVDVEMQEADPIVTDPVEVITPNTAAGGYMSQNYPWGREVEVMTPLSQPMSSEEAFIYETTYAYDAMSPLDYWDGYYPISQPSFTIDNHVSIDDIFK